jgi:hypothetical protein
MGKRSYITKLELNVTLVDYEGNNIGGRLRTFRGTCLQHAIRSLLLYAKDNPRFFPTGLIESNAELDECWRAPPLRPTFCKRPKRPSLKKK